MVQHSIGFHLRQEHVGVLCWLAFVVYVFLVHPAVVCHWRGPCRLGEDLHSLPHALTFSR
jgi:hypothetical protein